MSIGINWKEIWHPVWKSVWRTDFSPIPAPTPQRGAGSSKKRRKRVVEIDGEVFQVSSEEEALAILEEAREQAKAVAAKAVSRAVNAQKRPVGKVLADARKALLVPSIEAPDEVMPLALQVRRDIIDMYESAMRTIEVAALLAKRQREEEDDEDVLLLFI